MQTQLTTQRGAWQGAGWCASLPAGAAGPKRCRRSTHAGLSQRRRRRPGGLHQPASGAAFPLHFEFPIAPADRARVPAPPGRANTPPPRLAAAPPGGSSDGQGRAAGRAEGQEASVEAAGGGRAHCQRQARLPVQGRRVRCERGRDYAPRRPPGGVGQGRRRRRSPLPAKRWPSGRLVWLPSCAVRRSGMRVVHHGRSPHAHTAAGWRAAAPAQPRAAGRPNRRRRPGVARSVRLTLAAACGPRLPQLLEDHRGEDISELFMGGGSAGHEHSKARPGAARSRALPLPLCAPPAAMLGGALLSAWRSAAWPLAALPWLPLPAAARAAPPAAPALPSAPADQPAAPLPLRLRLRRARARCLRTTAWAGWRASSRRSRWVLRAGNVCGSRWVLPSCPPTSRRCPGTARCGVPLLGPALRVPRPLLPGRPPGLQEDLSGLVDESKPLLPQVRQAAAAAPSGLLLPVPVPVPAWRNFAAARLAAAAVPGASCWCAACIIVRLTLPGGEAGPRPPRRCCCCSIGVCLPCCRLSAGW